MLSEPDTDFELGDRVLFEGFLQRENQHAHDGPYAVVTGRYWEAIVKPGGPQEGVVVGKRTLSDGKLEKVYEDDVWGTSSTTEYRPTKHFTAYLVATNIRHKPVFVLPEHMRSLT